MDSLFASRTVSKAISCIHSISYSIVEVFTAIAVLFYILNGCFVVLQLLDGSMSMNSSSSIRMQSMQALLNILFSCQPPVHVPDAAGVLIRLVRYPCGAQRPCFISENCAEFTLTLCERAEVGHFLCKGWLKTP
jgi:hypothetical protein